MIYNKKEIKNQKILCVTICTLISFLPLTSFINDVFNKLVGNGFVYDSAVCYLIFWYLLARSLVTVIKNIKKMSFFSHSYFMPYGKLHIIFALTIDCI